MSEAGRSGGQGYFGAGGRFSGQGASMVIVLLSAAAWSTSGLFIKVLTLHPLVLTGVRSCIASVTLLPAMRLRTWRPEPWLLVLVVAATYTYLAFVAATRWTTAANAIALQSSAPAWVFGFSCLFTRQIPRPLLLPVGLILAGIVVMLAEPSEGTSLLGNLVGLSTGMTFAVTQLAFARIRQPALNAVVSANAAAGLLFMGTAALVVPGGLDLGSLSGGEWASMVYLGTFQVGLAFFAFGWAVRRISITQASVLALVEPLLNPIWVYLVVGEVPSSHGFTGLGLILAGIVTDTWLRITRPELRAFGAPRPQPLATAPTSG